MFNYFKKYKVELQQGLPAAFSSWFPQDSRRWVRKIENGISYILLMLLVFYSIALLTYGTGMLCRFSIVAGVFFGLIFCMFNISMLFHVTSCALEDLTPLPVVMALQYPRLPGFLRWIASLWWFFHFFLGIFFAFLSGYFNRPETFYDKITIGMMVFGFSYAANGFLLIALCGFGAGLKTIHTIWRYRIGLDLLNGILQLAVLHWLGTFQ